MQRRNSPKPPPPDALKGKTIRTSPLHQWEEVISDPSEKEVFVALSNPQWDFRTIQGISKETVLSESKISNIMEKYPDLIRQSLASNRHKQDLFTLRENPIKLRERLAEIRMFLAGWAA